MWWRQFPFYLAILGAIPVWLAIAYWTPSTGDGLSTWALIQGVLLAPVLEELVFRGGIQGWLHTRLPQRRLGGISWANVVTSILFSVVHLWRHHPLWAMSVMIPSLIFGWFRDRYESVIPGMVLHVCYNAGYFVLPMVLGG